MVNTRARIKKSRQHSADLISSSDDLLLEILLRLALTSVCQFKSVSKHWRSLLSSPPFTLLYKLGSNISPGLFVDDFYIPFDKEDQSPPPFHSLDFYPDRHGLKIIQSCNGLLLCCSKYAIRRDLNYYVFNPTTKQFARVPSVPGGGNVRRTIRYMGLAFHPTDFAHYKVVCIRYTKRDEDLLQIQIYSSDTRKWKISNQTIDAPYLDEYFQGVYWHRAVHLFSPFVDPCYLKLDTEEVQPLTLPAEVQAVSSREGYRPLYFGESRGHLHLVHGFTVHLDVYEMLSDCSGWFLKYRVMLMHTSFQGFQVLDVVRGEDENMTFIVIRIMRKIIRYNVLDKSFKLFIDLHICKNGPIAGYTFHRYIKTIASV